jgi:hypothetical protein
MKRTRVWRAALIAAILLCSAEFIEGQSASPDAGMPPPDPGYGLYYHGNEGLLEKATRWGYHDGWKQGHEDRALGHDSSPKGGANFQKPPDHGKVPGLSREEYERVYQSAFLHGYEHGYRL